MKICPKCKTLVPVIEGKDYVICPNCNEVIFIVDEPQD
jgi:DNA-directed RNA polymerase subunit RPC12/RpoP